MGSSVSHDPNGSGVGAPNSNRHSSDADGKRIPSKRAQVKGPDRNTFIEAEMLEARRLIMFEKVPVDRGDPRTSADSQLVERHRGMARSVHLRLIINNERKTPALRLSAAGSEGAQGSG
jgi:hypothetical protein